MTRMQSRPVTITQVYAQDTAPTDTRPGVLWVDTSVSPPKTYTYDADTASWEPVAVQNLYVQDTAPSAPENGEIWVDTSLTPPETKTYDATNAVWERQLRAAELDSHAATASAHHAKPTSTQTESASAGYESYTTTNSPQTNQIDRLSDEVVVTNNNGSASTTEVRMADGTTYSQSVAGNSTYTFSFTTGEIDEIYTQYSDTNYDVHLVGLAPHSHAI